MAVFRKRKFQLKDGRSVVLRSPKSDDLPMFREFIKKIGTETSFTNQTPLRPEASEERILKVWEDSKESEVSMIIFAVDEASGAIVGLLGLNQVSPQHPWLKHIASFATMIVKDYWGVGLGNKLLSEAIKHCEKVEIKRLEATVRTHNSKAISLYIKHGFEIEGCQKNTALIDGEMKDMYMIAKFFNLEK